MSTISHAVRKKSNRLRVDMRSRGGAGRGAESSTTAGRLAVSDVSGRLAMSSLGFIPPSAPTGAWTQLPCLFQRSGDRGARVKHSERRCRRARAGRAARKARASLEAKSLLTSSERCGAHSRFPELVPPGLDPRTRLGAGLEGYVNSFAVFRREGHLLILLA